MKADMHMHSTASPDAHMDPVEILRSMKAKGFGAIAILDHNSTKGSLAASKQAKEIGIILVRGLEVSSEAGHIGALRMEEEIPRGLSAEETVDRIHSLGGLAVALHPYRIGSGVGESVVRRCKFDAVEIVNGFTSNGRNRKAQRLADSLRLPYTAGSDAHFEKEIGMAYIEIEDCSDSEQLLASIVAGKGRPGGSGLGFGGTIKGAASLMAEWMGRGFKRM
jgi:predicted metal-dependent phosphoesterase TrpH